MEIRVTKIIKRGNRIEILYSSDAPYALEKIPPFFEYDFNVENIPDSIAIIPFIGIFLTATFITETKIYIDEIDKNFYEQLPLIKDTLSKSSHYEFNRIGQIISNKLIDNKYIIDESKNILLFSLGIDSFYSFLKLENNISDLVYIEGADIPLSNEKGLIEISNRITGIANKSNKIKHTIKSNFRIAHDENYFNNLNSNSGDYFQDLFHGPAYLCLVSVLAFHLKAKTIIISGSESPKLGLPCASNKKSDELFKFASSNTINYGENIYRYDKTIFISNYPITYNSIHPCYYSENNCSICEKCLTHMSILESCRKLDLYSNCYDFKLYKKNVYLIFLYYLGSHLKKYEAYKPCFKHMKKLIFKHFISFCHAFFTGSSEMIRNSNILMSIKKLYRKIFKKK